MPRFVAATWFLVPAIVAGLATYALYVGPRASLVDFENGYEGGFIDGFHGGRHDLTPGYRWTTRNAYIRFEHLPLGGELLANVRLSAPRPVGSPAPAVWFSANGLKILDTVAEPRATNYALRLPLERRNITLGIHSETFLLPGRGPAGVQVHGVELELFGGGSVPIRPALWMSASALLWVAGALAAGRSLRQACSIALAVSFGLVYLLAQGSVRFQDYVRDLFWVSVLAALVCVALRWWLARAPWLLQADRPALSGIVALGLFTSCIGILHPHFLSSDAVFQSNRMNDVLAGNFFPVSVTQHEPPLRIPYPIALYLLAAPWVALGLDSVRVLQFWVIGFQAAASLALAFLAGRFWGDSRAALIAAALYPAIPILWLALSAGNLTNLLGVSAGVLFLACWLMLWSGAVPAVVGVIAFSLLVPTAHFGTALMAVVLWPFWLMALYRYGQGPERRLAYLATGGVLVSVLMAALYYVGYWELLTTELKMLVDAASPAVPSMPLLSRIAFQLSLGRIQLGSVFSLIAIGGAAVIVGRGKKTPLDAMALAWLAVTVLFFVLDVTTPLGVRYRLQAAPLLALFAAVFLSWLAQRGDRYRLAARLVLMYLVIAGLSNFLDCVLVRYH